MQNTAVTAVITYNNYSGTEQYHKALEIYIKALKIEDQLGNLPRKANLLNLIGSAYSEIGENDIALETYREGLKIETKLNNISNKIYFLNSIGVLYSKIGDNTLAIEKFKEGLTLADKLDDFREKKRIIEMLESHIPRNKKNNFRQYY